MMCWICNFKANYEVSSDSLLSKLGLHVIDVVLRCRSRKLRKSWDEVLLDDEKEVRIDIADP